MRTQLRCLTFLVAFLFPPLINYAQDNTVRNIAGGLNYQAGFLDNVVDTAALFYHIAGITGDSAGNLYVYDEGNLRIRKINAVTHMVTTIAGNGTPGFSGDGGPSIFSQFGTGPSYNLGRLGICTDNVGNVYFSDYGNGRIRKINTATGVISTFAGGGSSFADGVSATTANILPIKLAYNAGYIYEGDDRSSIRKINISTGIISTVIDTIIPGIFGGAYDFAFDRNGALYTLGLYNNIRKLDTAGVITVIAGQPSVSPSHNGQAAINYPVTGLMWGISIDSVGNIYFGQNFVIEKIDHSTGLVNNVAGIAEFSHTSIWPYQPFVNHLTPRYADRVWTGAALPAMYRSPDDKLYIVYGLSSIIQYNPPAYTFGSLAFNDTLLSPQCTLPATRAYTISGTITGVPSSGDSVTIDVDFRDGHTAHLLRPYYSYLDGTGSLVYGFNSGPLAFNNTFTYPGLYHPLFKVSNRHGVSDFILAADTAGSSCDYFDLTFVNINSMVDSITTPPCSALANVRMNVDGNSFTFGAGSSLPGPTDSVYARLDWDDGSAYQFIVVPYDGPSTNTFHISANHNYPMGTGPYMPRITLTLNSGISEVDETWLAWPATAPTFSIPDCSTGTLTSGITTTDSALTICSLPFTTSFSVGSTLEGSAATTSSLSYNINFGDGSDTNIVVYRSTDGLGSYYMLDTVYHTYTIPGAYVTAVTPSDTSGTVTGAVLTIGTSCSPLSGVCYRDGNANCIADAAETRLGYWPIAVINNTLHDTTYSWCDTFGHYALSLINGNAYTIIPNYFGYFGLGTDSFTLSCPSSGIYNITPSSGGSYTQDFGFTCAGTPLAIDMSVSGWGWGFVPGDTGIIGIWSSNEWGYMCDSLNTTVTLAIDPLLTYIGMWDGPAPTTISGNTLLWSFHTAANLLDFHADVKVRTATTATMGASACNTFHVAPTSLPDNDTSNNTYSWCEAIRSSWDPNEKEVSPQGFGPEGFIENGTPLSYVIHFQNTGTAPARNITINDTISSNLDIATLQVISSSGAVLVVQPELSGNLIKFRFNDIYLPDSTSNPDGSRGYIAYSIVPRSGLAAGTQIKNTAGIYFDYNAAIVTNTTLNTIEATVGPIAGGASVCVGAALSLSNTLSGGIWSASNAHATISASGVVTGVTPGTDTISYTMYGDKTVTHVITISGVPDAVTITGAGTVCAGANITLAASVTGGSWTATNTTASVISGVVTGTTPGTDTIIYSITGTCGSVQAEAIVVVSPAPVAGTLSGISAVCVGAMTTLTPSVIGGAWTVGNGSASVTSGVVTGVLAGTDTIAYAVSNTCGTAVAYAIITINPLPAIATVSGDSSVCIGSTITLTPSVLGGTWSATGTSATVAGGIVTAVAAGTDTIAYTISNTCGSNVTNRIIAINPLPVAGVLSGSASICVGSSATISSTATGGVWTSANMHATVVGGVVSAVTQGVDTILYTVSNSCGNDTAMHVIAINTVPAAGTITGAGSVCIGSSVTLTDTVSGGIWDVSTGAASITAGGVLTGISADTVLVFYSLTNICGSASDTILVSVDGPANAGTIVAPSVLCIAGTASLTGATSGGTWSSAGVGIVTIDASGVVTGVSAGTTTITYILAGTCGSDTATAAVTVTPAPAIGAITGSDTVCEGSSASLTNTVAGGTWTSMSPGLLSVNSSGVVTGLSPGIATINYATSNSCGIANAAYTVTVLSIADCPTAVSGVPTLQQHVAIYPNPNNGMFTIDLPASQYGGTITIMDVYGKVINEIAVTSTSAAKVPVSLVNLASGTYIVSITIDSITYHEKIVIW